MTPGPMQRAHNQPFDFDRAAHDFDRKRGFPPGVGDEVAAKLAQRLGLMADSRVLEIGVGTGRIGRPVLARGIALTGVDLSRGMLTRLRLALPAGTRAPQLIQGEATRLPLASGVFDAVLIVHVLHLIRAWRDAVAHALRVLRPGGLLVGGWNEHPPTSSARRISEKFAAIVAAHGVSLEGLGLAHIEDLVPALESTGYQVTGERLVAAEWTVERAPRQALQAIAERHFSASWLVPDEVFPACLAELQAWADAEFGDLERLRTEPRSFVWLVIRQRAAIGRAGQG